MESLDEIKNMPLGMVCSKLETIRKEFPEEFKQGAKISTDTLYDRGSFLYCLFVERKVPSMEGSIRLAYACMLQVFHVKEYL